MSGKLLYLLLCIFLTYVMDGVCLDENFDYWYSSDDGLVPGLSYMSQRTQNSTSKRHINDDDSLTNEILDEDFANTPQVVLRGLNKGLHCTNLLCSMECFSSGKRTPGFCKHNRCVCNSGYRSLRTYQQLRR